MKSYSILPFNHNVIRKACLHQDKETERE